MKRLFNIFAICLLQLVLFAQVGWAADSYTLTVSTNVKNNASVTYQGVNTLEAGSTINLETWVQSNGYHFLHWKANGEVVSTNKYFTYTMPNNDVDMVAVYEFSPTNPGDPASAENMYKLTLVSQPANVGYFGGQPTNSKVQAGELTTVYAYVDNGSYVFSEWQIDGQTVSRQQEYNFEMPAKNLTLTAVYEFCPPSPGNPGTNAFDEASGELMLDEFTAGNTYTPIYQATGGAFEKVQTVIVIGTINNWDAGDIAGSCNNLSTIDVSRTTGMTRPYSFENKSRLVTISLPATVTNISSYTFGGCTSLQTINLYAVTPPQTTKYAFGDGSNNVASQVTVFVPANSLALYKEAAGWKDLIDQGLTLLPFTSQVCDLQVSLPDGVSAAPYKDMYLEAYNTKSGQSMRFVITDRETYTFSNVIQNTTWDIYVKNANGEVLGEIKGVEVGTASREVAFQTLKTPRDITLKVLTPAEEDVTAQTTVAWTDKAGNFLTQGATLKNRLEGNEVKYRVTLSEALAMQYQLPAEGEYTVVDGDNSVNVQLTALPQVTINGVVTNHNNSSEPLPGAIIAVSQTVNGQYSKTFAVKTNAEGQWTLTVFDAPTEMTVSKTGFISQSRTFENLTNVTAIDPFDLRDINGTSINITLTYQTLDGEQTDYEDVANVAFTVVNATSSETLTGWSLQYPKIVMQEKLPEGTPLAVTATSKNQKFVAQTANATVNGQDKADVTFVIKQLGGIKATYNQTENNGACVGILYDANGMLLKRYDYNGNNLVISELKDGNYTLVTMANSQLFNNVGQLSQFAESGLRNGVDFVRNNVTVKSGEWTIVTITKVPYLDETKLYYTGPNTSFTANKSQVTAGQYLTLRAQVDFKDTYVRLVSNVQLVINLTEDCEFVDNSVMLGKDLTSYTLNGKQLIVPIGNSTEQVRFCVIPTKEGTYEPTASVSFTIGGKDVLQPIGSAQTTVKGVTISVPVTIAEPQFVASGTAIAKSDVSVYADDILVSKTKVKANGQWTAQCQLTDAADKSTHPVYAVVVTPQNAELTTDTKMVTLDEDAILAQQVEMSFYNGWLRRTVIVDWDMREKKANPTSYMFYNTTEFTFTIRFTANDPEKISDVQLIVYKNNSSYDILNAIYDAKKHIWVCTHRYSSYALPTAVKVKYKVNDEQQTLSEDTDDEGIQHSNPILDPSGYVYEAVSTNRLEGVTASLYYKEVKEDAYGDPYEEVSLWDAEEYAQQNPLFTDENGMYQWDVPGGLWQVRLEKEGYLKTNSEWLPVPPPQLDVNLPMTQMKQPNVEHPTAFAEGIEFQFDKYMDPATLTAENIIVTRNGNPVEGEIVLLDEEAVSDGAVQTYASKVRFNAAEELLSTDEIRLTVRKAVESYAGVQMEKDFTQDFTVEPVVRSIKVDADLDLVNVTYGETRTVTVAALPADAGKGKTLTIESLSEQITKVNATELLLDENGQAEVVISGELPGATMLNFGVAGTDVEGQLAVNVKEAAQLVTLAPRASRVSGAKLYRGDKIQLSSETDGAVIKYTVDGSNPAVESESVITYKADEPIVITDDNVTIKAIAEGKDLAPSEVSQFGYELKKSNIGYNLTGWTWVSHNLETPVPVAEFAGKAQRIVSQTNEVINDPQFGFIGALTELQPAMGYKILVGEPTEKNINGYELNANENTVSVKSGWNWIGYPLNQIMTVDEALEYFEATTGDIITGNDGTAEYDGTQWQGTLKGMQPGQGYLFKTATTADIQFNTNFVSKAGNFVGKRNWLIGSPWANDKHAYPNIMPLTAEFFVDGMKYDDGEYVVAAFAGDECRGVGQWIEGRLMMNVCGNGGEEITFMAYNKTSEQYYTVNEHMTFKADNEGSWFAPAKLTLGGQTTDIQQLYGELTVTPAVARDHITVSAGGRYISGVSLTNMGGATVLSVHDLGTGATITTSSLQDGLYILTVQAGGKTYYRKILKANQ